MAIIDTTLLSVVMFTGLALWAFYENETSGGLFMLALGYFVLLPLYLNARLLCSQVQISENEIIWDSFGIKIRKIKWSESKSIRIVSTYNIAVQRETNIYSVDSLFGKKIPFFPGGPIIFDDTIQGYDHLIELVHGCANEYQIPIIDNRRNGERTG